MTLDFWNFQRNIENRMANKLGICNSIYGPDIWKLLGEHQKALFEVLIETINEEQNLNGFMGETYNGTYYQNSNDLLEALVLDLSKPESFVSKIADLECRLEAIQSKKRIVDEAKIEIDEYFKSKKEEIITEIKNQTVVSTQAVFNELKEKFQQEIGQMAEQQKKSISDLIEKMKEATGKLYSSALTHDGEEDIDSINQTLKELTN